MLTQKKHQQAVIVAGLRTPFTKAHTVFSHLSALDLAKHCVSELIQRVNCLPSAVDAVIYGQVIPSLKAPNIAREIVIGTCLDNATDAFTVSRACATSYQTTISAIQHIESGNASCIIAGGADSISQVPLALSDRFRDRLLTFRKNKSWEKKLSAWSGFTLADLSPQFPVIKECSTGLSMGESCEKMAKENSISRQMQDDYAHQSHQRAASAWRAGKFANEVMAICPPPTFDHFVMCDNVVRLDSDREAYNALKPVFDKKYGTLTAGNSSPLSDGASALLIMSETLADKLNIKPLGKVISYDFAAVDPFKQLLIGPVFAIPRVLAKADLGWSELDLIDMHEAFAAQVLSVLKVFQDDTFAKKNFNLEGAHYAIDFDKFNVNGGSIALGHPFAATGARQILQTLNELKRRKQKTALCSACAAGGLSAAVVLEAI